ncbi:MAG TPA: hypothetical protein VLL30_26540 [Reyranella sp.]|nr:hypothetical protein [Reyranella sp.]
MKYLSALLALVVLPLAALAQGVTPLPPISVITFTPGSNTATMNGRMMPGGRDLYYVQAGVGAIPRDGKYLITVGAGASGPAAPTPYSLTVSLP